MSDERVRPARCDSDHAENFTLTEYARRGQLRPRPLIFLRGREFSQTDITPYGVVLSVLSPGNLASFDTSCLASAETLTALWIASAEN